MESYKSFTRKGTTRTTHKPDHTQIGSSSSKPGTLIKPNYVSSINDSNYALLSNKLQTKLSSNPSHPISHRGDKVAKTPKELASDVKKCISELKKEATLCINTSKKSHKTLPNRASLNEMAENPETLDSFSIKTPSSTGHPEIDLKKSPQLSKTDVGDLKFKIEFLMENMQRSEHEAKMHEMENLKLKEVIRTLEDKIDNIQRFHDPGSVSCSGNCQVF